MPGPYLPTIVAHRGLHTRAPENSLHAFFEAVYADVTWIECDVWPTADGAAVVIHDETLDRTTTGSGPVGRHRWEDLSRLRLRGLDGRPNRNLPLPSLPGLVRSLFSWPGVGLLVEIKPPDAPAFVSEVIDVLADRRGPWRIQSFHEENLLHAMGVDTTVPLAFLVENPEAMERAVAYGWKNIHARHDLLDDAVVRRLRDNGCSIGAWTPNSVADLGRVMALGVDFIITDEPLRAMEMLHAGRAGELPAGPPSE